MTDEMIESLCAEVELLTAENGRLTAMLKHEAEDWADTDTYCRQQAALVLPRKTVYGDSDAVPAIEDVVQLLVAKIERLIAVLEACVADMTGWDKEGRYYPSLKLARDLTNPAKLAQ